jgi:hypothetical protein
MKWRKTIPIWAAVTAFLLVQSLPAYQAEGVGTDNTQTPTDNAKTTKKKKSRKSSEAAAEATSTPATPAEKAEGPTHKARKHTAMPAPETSNVVGGAATKGNPSSIGTASREAPSAAPAPSRTVSESEIQSAKASGQVWVNTDTGVYHTGGRWYGATKHGKFMSEQDALRNGYRASKSKP